MGGVDAAILFIGGLVATLYGLRRIGKKPGVDLLYDQWFARVRSVLLVAGLLMMIVGLVLSLPEPPPPPPPQWQTVTTSDGVCSAEMPGKPSEEESPSALEGFAKPAAHQWLLVEENGQVQYYLSHSDIEGGYAELPSEKLLETISGNWFRAANSKEDAQRVSERDLSNKGWPGRELVIDKEDKRLQNRWLVVDKRLYRAYVLTPRDEPHLRDAARFLDSFHVLKPTPAAKGS